MQEIIWLPQMLGICLSDQKSVAVVYSNLYGCNFDFYPQKLQ